LVATRLPKEKECLKELIYLSLFLGGLEDRLGVVQYWGGNYPISVRGPVNEAVLDLRD